MTKMAFEIAHHQKENDDDIKQLQEGLRSLGVTSFKTERGLLESDVRAGTPSVPPIILDLTAYIVSLIITSYLGGPIGELGTKHWNVFASWLKRVRRKNLKTKDMLLLVELTRKDNFPLNIGFVVSNNISDTDLLSALNLIPRMIGVFKREIEKYRQRDVILVHFIDRHWNLENLDFQVINRGSSIQPTLRALKLYGVCEEKYYPNRPGETAWQILNSEGPSERARQNALKHRIDYYQRLHSSDDIRRAVFAFSGAMASFKIFESILSAPQGVVPMPGNERSIGQHSIAIAGYTPEHLIFMNSWGAGWGDRGTGKLSSEYVDSYLVEAWASQMLPTISLKTFLKPKVLFRILDERKKKKKVDDGFFSDAGRKQIKYELYSVQPINPRKGQFFVLDLYDQAEKNNVKGGWAHFSIRDSNIEIEELFIDTKNRNLGWGSKLIGLMSDHGVTSGIQKLTGWVTAEDCFDEFQRRHIETFFRDNGFSISEDRNAFPGALLKIEKLLTGNK